MAIDHHKIAHLPQRKPPIFDCLWYRQQSPLGSVVGYDNIFSDGFKQTDVTGGPGDKKQGPVLRIVPRMHIVVIGLQHEHYHNSEKLHPMNKRNLTYFRKQLLKELEDLSVGADCNFDGLNSAQSDSPDLIDRAARYIDRNLSQNFCDRKNLRVKKLEQALEDLEAGLYGICQRCGEDIAVKRLKANLAARQCISCKTEMETKQRLTGG